MRELTNKIYLPLLVTAGLMTHSGCRSDRSQLANNYEDLTFSVVSYFTPGDDVNQRFAAIMGPYQGQNVAFALDGCQTISDSYQLWGFSPSSETVESIPYETLANDYGLATNPSFSCEGEQSIAIGNPFYFDSDNQKLISIKDNT